MNSTNAGPRLVPRGTPGSTSLLKVAAANAGPFTGGKAVGTLMSWAIAEAMLGRPLGDGQGVTAAVEEYSSWWKQSRRTTFRELAAFRKAFPSEESPARLAAEARKLRAANAEKAQGFKGYANLPVLA